MKKLFYTIALVIALQSVYSQSFNGVAISGSMSTAVNAFKAKGFVVDEVLENMTIMKGKIQMQSVELYIKVTPKTRQVYAFSMYFSKQISWSGILAEYNRYKNILTEKYGSPDNEYDFFTTPYYLGDGYELQALKLEKCSYATYWFNKDNMNVAIEMSKYQQVNMSYENVKLVEVRQKEVQDLNKTIF